MGLLSEMAAEMLERIKTDPKTVGPLGRLVDREALARALAPAAPTTPAKAPKEADPNEDTPAKLAADVRALLASPAARQLATKAAAARAPTPGLEAQQAKADLLGQLRPLLLAEERQRMETKLQQKAMRRLGKRR
jgi:hypothetical protein